MEFKKTLKDGWIFYKENFLPPTEADKIFHHLLNTLKWESGEIKMFGKSIKIPREEVYFADKDKNYSYSGRKMDLKDWDEELLILKSKVEEFSLFKFNACLANLYRTGQDSNGWHADNEKMLGKNPVIASLSFGQERKFQLKHNNKQDKFQLKLNHGSLLIMGGGLQHFWKHQVPKEKNVINPRINLTFRNIIS